MSKTERTRSRLGRGGRHNDVNKQIKKILVGVLKKFRLSCQPILTCACNFLKLILTGEKQKKASDDRQFDRDLVHRNALKWYFIRTNRHTIMVTGDRSTLSRVPNAQFTTRRLFTELKNCVLIRLTKTFMFYDLCDVRANGIERQRNRVRELVFVGVLNIIMVLF